MYRLAVVILALVISCGITAATSKPPYLCPTLSIEGPNRILKPGETAKFTAKVVAHGPELQIKYKWSTSYGKILSGQGTSMIEVEKPPSSTLIVTVTIAGTPDDSHCPLWAHGTVMWDAPAECPTVSVIGPAGITLPGEKFVFTGAVEGDVSKNVSFQWEVSGGRIVDGQGTLRMSADADWKQGGASVTATLNVLGLPDGCPKSASENGSVVCKCDSVLIDEFGRLPIRAIKKKLDDLIAELGKNPNDQGYVILYGTEKEMNSRERLITDGILRIHHPPRITIVRGGTRPDGKIYTKLYRVPPGADNPAP